MIKFFRKIRKNLLSEGKIGKYLKYAIGEIILVVIGILIALQINNWNQNKIEKKALSDYLISISQNIKTDIESLSYLKKSRIDAVSSSSYLTFNLIFSEYLDREDVMFGSETLARISSFEYFNSDLSGFESIKNSGYLSKLKGKKIENLIYKYYHIVKEIELKEKDLNEILRESFNNFSNKGFEKLIYVTYPVYIGNKDELNDLQPYLKEIIFHSSAQALYNQTFQRVPEIIVNYENLAMLGKQIVELIDCNSLDASSLNNLGNLFNLKGAKGYSTVLINGTVLSDIYLQGWDSSSNESLIMTYGINELTIETREIDWAVVYYRNPSNAMIERPIKDFSDYSRIKLELKGKEGGEIVYIALKDRGDADDGSESRVPLTLSNNWETYEIDLSEFKTANLKELFVVASLIFQGDAKTIRIRRIEYLK